MASGCKVWCCVWSWWQAETSLDPTPGLWRELRTQVLMTRPEREFLLHLNVKPFLQCFLKGPFLVLTAHNQPFGVPGSPTAHPGRCPFGRGDAMQQGAGTATALWLHKDVCQWHLQQLWQTQCSYYRLLIPTCRLCWVVARMEIFFVNWISSVEFACHTLVCHI